MPISAGLAAEQCPLTGHRAQCPAGKALCRDRPSLPGHSQGQAPVTNPPCHAGGAAGLGGGESSQCSGQDGSSPGHAARGGENRGDPASRVGEERMCPDVLARRSRATLPLCTRAARGAPGELASAWARGPALPFTSFHVGAAQNGPTRSWEHESHRGRDRMGTGRSGVGARPDLLLHLPWYITSRSGWSLHLAVSRSHSSR